METIKGFMINSEEDINRLFDALAAGTIDDMIENESEEIIIEEEETHDDFLDNWISQNDKTVAAPVVITYVITYNVQDLRKENGYWKVFKDGHYVGNITSNQCKDKWFFSQKNTKTLHPVFSSPAFVKEFISSILK